ncbi:MAG: ankyrin repeat domain-containing protein [Planctomycetes bacterium]|nr:ankyrin repeat domain-containing protein [Planctomycetota bacterium]
MRVRTKICINFIFLVVLIVALSKYFGPRNSKEYLPEPYVGPEIHLAAMQGDIETVRSILSEKPKLFTQTDKYGNSPLHLAAYKGHAEVVQFLILQGTDVNVRNNFGGTALLVGSYADETEVVKILIANKADVNLAIKDPEQQALQIATLEGYRDYTHMFIDLGGVNNLKTHFIATPLQASAANGHIEIAKILIERGAKVNAIPTGFTALHSAAVNSHKELVSLLIDYGARVDVKSSFGLTPLCSAMFHSRDLKDRDLMDDVAKILIENGADVNFQTRSGYTPLHYAAGWANKETVELLLSIGVDVNAKTDEGDTPLNVACRYRRKKRGGVIDLLHKNGAVRKHGKNHSYEYEPDLIGMWP